MISDHSYKNPFADYNANVMDSQKILEYWCSPLDLSKTSQFSESDIYRERMPIVLMGGRGSGKTMFMKYHSYQVQLDKQKKGDACKSTINHFIELGGAGFYIRIDGPVLRSFSGKGLSQEKWDYIFTHYFELQISKFYLLFIQEISNECDFKEGIDSFLKRVSKLIGLKSNEGLSLSSVLDLIEEDINYVNNFRAEIAFSDIAFEPRKIFSSQDLIFNLPLAAKETIRELSGDFNFVLFIDEYENFQIGQQRIINTLLKFVKIGITFRLGMRLEGFRTFETIAKEEFVKEGRDYHKIVFEELYVKGSNFVELLSEIAKKRLETVPIFKEKGFTNIANFLGKNEDLEKEALDLLEGKRDRRKHFELLKDSSLSKEEIELLRHDQNPLLEMMNIILALRGESPSSIHARMSDFLQKEETEDAIKYKNAYINKYKLSLMFIFASIYKSSKKYYSLNTFAFLSSGIIGNFIELCRKSFQAAYFDNRDKLFDSGYISTDTQDKAAKNLANSEILLISRIEDYGEKLLTFTKNLGNIFRSYHLDTNITYPETNQFAIDHVDDPLFRDAFNAALKWSVLQRKPILQSVTPGSQRENIYLLNRIYSPAFQITYRVRGGYSIALTSDDLRELMTKDSPQYLFQKKKKSKKGNTENPQADLF